MNSRREFAEPPGVAHVLRQERLISTAINALVPAAIIRVLDATPPVAVFGRAGLLGAVLPAAGLATFVMTLVLTTVIRARVRSGALPALEGGRRPRAPRNLLLRALALGTFACLLLAPPAIIAVSLSGLLPFDRVEFLIFNLLFGSAVGLTMTPFVVLTALADGART